MARHERPQPGFSRSCTAPMAMPRCAPCEPPGPQFAMQNWIDIHSPSRDGLRLYARHCPAPGSALRPVVCLAGLTRNCRDFHDLATALAAGDETGRDVYAIDSRGRGRSQNDANWKNYSILIELNDVLDFMTMKGLDRAAVIGTSRGGLIAMLMAVLRPNAMGVAVLNDIGPVIEREGLSRIVAYVGRVPLPDDWKEATELVTEMNRRQFTAVAHVPLLAIRGENSDILSEKTFAEMRVRHPRMTAVMVRGQGHAPLLMDAPTIDAIADFLARSDGETYAGVPALSAAG